MTTKDVLLKIVADLEELRANQVLLTGQVNARISPADAVDALSAAKYSIAPIYAALRKDVESLS
jgi:hypothetical protein